MKAGRKAKMLAQKNLLVRVRIHPVHQAMSQGRKGTKNIGSMTQVHQTVPLMTQGKEREKGVKK